MPLHGLRADLELAGLILSAFLASYLITDAVFSNVLFTVLITALFFLAGLNISPGSLAAKGLRKRQIVIGLMLIFLLVPLISLIFAALIPSLRDAIIVVGISAAALGSPAIWSNMVNADGELASNTAALSLLISLPLIPLLILATGLQINFWLLLRNSFIPLTGLVLGMIVRRFRNPIVNDLKLHFSKLSFWLIIVITGVQTHSLIVNRGLQILYTFGFAALVFFVFTFLCFASGYLISRKAGLYEKEARAAGFLTGSKSIAIAFLLSIHLNGLTVALIGIYYFVRQLAGLIAVDLFIHGEFKSLKRVVLKASQPLTKLKN